MRTVEGESVPEFESLFECEADQEIEAICRRGVGDKRCNFCMKMFWRGKACLLSEVKSSFQKAMRTNDHCPYELQ